MSQPTTWGAPRAAETPVTPETFADRTDDSLDALLSSHSGATRPAYAVAGTVWHDTDDASLQHYDGTNDRALAHKDRAPAVLGSVAGVDTITATLTPTLTAYADLTLALLVTAGANTGAVTLNIDSLGAKSVVKAGGAALAASDLASGAAYLLWYDAANDRFQVIGM